MLSLSHWYLGFALFLTLKQGTSLFVGILVFMSNGNIVLS